jgi:stage III sporulation protein AA
MSAKNLLKYFPESISSKLEEYLNANEKDITMEEIRLRVGKPMILKFSESERIYDGKVTAEEVIETLQYICENSIYSYQNQICNGYITVYGGHRVGVVGTSVIEKNKVVNLKHISGLNVRIAKEIMGCSSKLLKYVLKVEENSIYNSIIISPPGVRKNNND